MASKTNRGKVWSDEATRALITLWSEETIQISLETCKTSRQTSKVYQILLNQLESKRFEGFTLKELINKMKKLRHKYKQEKDKNRRTGNGAGKKWKFFNDIDQFLESKHNVTPPTLVDTMASNFEQSSAKEDNEAIVDDMVEKYGKGEMSVRKCANCDYEQEIRSEGVHVSEGGAVSVFSFDDEFFCPNCNLNFHERSDEVADEANDEYKKDKDMPEDVGKGTKSPDDVASTKEKLPGKKKRKSSMEKSLDIVFDKMKETSDSDFDRYQKLEEERIAVEHEFRMKQIELEKEMRKEEREHELKMLQMLMGQHTSSNALLPSPNSFNIPVSGFMHSSTSPATPERFNNGDTLNFSMYSGGSENQTYYKL